MVCAFKLVQSTFPSPPLITMWRLTWYSISNTLFCTACVAGQTGYVNVDKLSFFPLTQWVFKTILFTFICEVAGRGENFDFCFFTPGRGDTANPQADVQASDKHTVISDQQIINFLTGNLFSVTYNELWQLVRSQVMKVEINFAFLIFLTEPKDVTVKIVLYISRDF